MKFAKQVSENTISRQVKCVISLDSKINFIKQFSECIWFYTDLSKGIKTIGWKNASDDCVFHLDFVQEDFFFFFTFNTTVVLANKFDIVYLCPYFVIFSYNTVTLIKYFQTCKMIASCFNL